MNVTFVCTGNTCRSPMAEGLFNMILKNRGIENIECRSCGIYAFPGDEPTPEAVSAANELGADISAHRSAPVNQYIIDSTDVFVCMTASHAAAIKSVSPNSDVRVLGGGIPDPYGRGADVYRQCAQIIYENLLILADVLTSKTVPFDESCVSGAAELEKECFSAPWSEDSIKAELHNETAHFLAAKSGGKVLGYIGVHEVAGEAYIANIAVGKKYRRQHIAQKLLLAAVTGAKERQNEFISLEVRKSNSAAIALYEKYGFKKAGERRNFYTNPAEDALIMTLTFTKED
ncbi:MAG: ribosomal protein S18-alanine N-acetyltransferase [Clostridia bacterium]|nr:ribosomal protein S18-alanine N-acetyltransferase [Clostridia bacterium]